MGTNDSGIQHYHQTDCGSANMTDGKQDMCKRKLLLLLLFVSYC